MAHLKLIGVALIILICVALAVGVLNGGQVLILTNAPSTVYARGYGAYIMAAAWLSLGAAVVFAALIGVAPNKSQVFERCRDVSIFLFAALNLVALLMYFAQTNGGQ